MLSVWAESYEEKEKDDNSSEQLFLHPNINFTSYTVKQVLVDFAIFNWWRHCKALCEVKFSKIEGMVRKFSHIELNNGAIR